MDVRVNIVCRECGKKFSKLVRDYENKKEIKTLCPYCEDKAKIVLKKNSIKEVYRSC